MHQAPLPETDCRIYLYAGSEEGAGKTTIQKHAAVRNGELYRLLERGFGRETVRFEVGPGEVPEWPQFAKRFPEALLWMFPNKR
ncbi:hypothetical protein [Paenibacillus sp. GYB003]|uniref:hypothetical protein n=1 Tax=Paenibacillus sp. GYB003 TaxID=2994392 RepID=UPI002F96CEF4